MSGASLCRCGHPEEAHTFDRSIPAAPRDTCHATIHVDGGIRNYSFPCPCKKFEKSRIE